MTKTKKQTTSKRIIVSCAVLLSLSFISYIAASQTVYAAACVSVKGSATSGLAIQTI